MALCERWEIFDWDQCLPCRPVVPAGVTLYFVLRRGWVALCGQCEVWCEASRLCMMSFSNQLVTTSLSSPLLSPPAHLVPISGGIEIHCADVSVTQTIQTCDCSVLRSINEKFICSTNRKLINFPTRRDSQLTDWTDWTDWTSHWSFCGLISFCVIGQFGRGMLGECGAVSVSDYSRSCRTDGSQWDDRDVVKLGGEQRGWGAGGAPWYVWGLKTHPSSHSPHCPHIGQCVPSGNGEILWIKNRSEFNFGLFSLRYIIWLIFWPARIEIVRVKNL